MTKHRMDFESKAATIHSKIVRNDCLTAVFRIGEAPTQYAFRTASVIKESLYKRALAKDAYLIGIRSEEHTSELQSH